jgi:hypothetical protein
MIRSSGSTTSVTLTEDLTIPLEVVALEKDVTRTTLQTLRVETAAIFTTRVPFHGLEVVALYTGVTACAERPVSLVVMLCAEGTVIENVEIGCLEGRVAFIADETATVVSTCQTSV